LPDNTALPKNKVLPGRKGRVVRIATDAGPPPKRVGPIRTHTVVVREADGHVVCRVQALDAGADDLLVAQATVTLQRY